MLLDTAKRLRPNPTNAENALWCHLRAHRLQGHKFKRQQPLGRYIVDFVCVAGRIIVEVDGSQHMDSKADAERDAWLNSQGFQVLRFWDNDVLQNMDSVLESILAFLSPFPQPLSHEGRGESPRTGTPPAATSLVVHEQVKEQKQTDVAVHSNPSLSPRGRGIEGEGA
jgi:very-short-patch-repair endonuclease